MTSRSDPHRESGFTLIEILVVLIVLALASGIVLLRGPARPRGVDLHATALGIADTLRLARAQAIAHNQPAQVLIDAETRRLQTAAGAIRPLPQDIALGFNTLAGPTNAPRLVIRFAPDGSSSGGAINLAAGGRKLRVHTTWLTGQVSVTDVP